MSFPVTKLQIPQLRPMFKSLQSHPSFSIFFPFHNNSLKTIASPTCKTCSSFFFIYPIYKPFLALEFKNKIKDFSSFLEPMSHMRYIRVGSKKSSSSSCHGIRGFRINPRRFSVQRLRTKFLYLLKLLNKWRSSYGNALQSMRKNLASSGSCKRGSTSRRNNFVVMEEARPYNYGMDDRRLRSFSRTNSFYSEAIADCLDFIKRNSLSMDENPVINQR